MIIPPAAPQLRGSHSGRAVIATSPTTCLAVGVPTASSRLLQPMPAASRITNQLAGTGKTCGKT
jgi:hypothetical protein